MKNIFILLFTVCLTLINQNILHAQSDGLSISGKVFSSGDNEPLEGAHLLLVNSFTGKNREQLTNKRGEFAFEKLTAGIYILNIQHLGYASQEVKIRLIKEDQSLNDIVLKSEAINLDEVEVKEKVPMAVQKDDTTEFKANAYKTLPDATAEELVEKMPTIQVENGTVKAQGEDVKEVLVDGKPFFGNDPMAALRNLPAEVIDKIQVFDQQSDQARFTGFDDGETSKTMNIITRANMRNGQFGKIYAGYGTDDRYTAGGNVHVFNGDQRISLIGMSNNINQQNFSSEDLLGVTSGGGGRGGFGRGRGGGFSGRSRGGGGASARDFLIEQQGGISTTHSIGLNYSDEWGKKVDVNLSYFFNYGKNETTQFTDRAFVGIDDGTERYLEINGADSKNSNHRLNGRINIELDSMNSLIIRPRLSAQFNKGISTTFGQNFLGDLQQSETLNRYESDLDGINFYTNILWRHKFQRDRRTLSFNVSPAYAPKVGSYSLLTENTFFDGGGRSDTLDQIANLDQYNWSVGTNLSYTEPVGERSMLILDYRFRYQQEDSDRETYDFNPESEEYDALNPFLSNVFSNDYITHQIGGGYNYRKDKLSITARANYQYATLNNKQTFPETGRLDKDFHNILPTAMIRYTMSRMKNIMIGYRTRTSLPTIDQLQNVIDNTNPLFLSAGNPDLDQSVQHTFFARYSSTNTEKSTIFFAMLGGGFTTDYISNATFTSGTDIPGYPGINLPPGAQFTLPVNVDGYYNLRSFLTYGMPLNSIKSNLNLNLSSAYSKIPGLSNNVETYSNNTNVGLGAVLSSNISDKVDFNISSRSGFNFVTNSTQMTGNSDFFQQTSRLRINWIFGPGIIVRNDLTHEYYSGLSEELDPNYWLWNISIGKKVFKNQRGEIALVAFDILKENQNVSRNVTDVFVEDVQTNTLQQYFLLKFTYNLRNFNLNNQQQQPFFPEGMRPPFDRKQ